MKIFTNSICASIPKTNFFDKYIWKSIVRKRKSRIYWWRKKRYEVYTRTLTIETIEKGDFFQISCEYLPGMENVNKFRIFFLSDNWINFIDISLGSPRISVHYCKINLIRVDFCLLKIGFLQTLNAPRNVGGLSLLLKLS
jgi:hypothetical protein